jgi:hypothetical protein
MTTQATRNNDFTLPHIPHPPRTFSTGRPKFAIHTPLEGPSVSQLKLWLVRVCVDIKAQAKSKPKPPEKPPLSPESPLEFPAFFRLSKSPSPEENSLPSKLSLGFPSLNLNAAPQEKSPEGQSLLAEFKKMKQVEAIPFVVSDEKAHRNAIENFQYPRDLEKILAAFKLPQ